MLSADNICNQFDPRSGPMKKSYFLAQMDSCACTFNDFPTSSDLIHLLITYAISLDPGQDSRKKQLILKQKPADANKSMKNYPADKVLKKEIKCDLTTSNKLLW